MKKLHTLTSSLVSTSLFALLVAVILTTAPGCGAMDEEYNADFPIARCPTLKERFGELVVQLDDDAWPATQGFIRALTEEMKRDVFEAVVLLFERAYPVLKYGASPLPETFDLTAIAGPEKEVVLSAVATARASLDACDGSPVFPLLRAAADDLPFFDALVRLLLEGRLMEIAERYCSSLAGGACDDPESPEDEPALEKETRAVAALTRFLLNSMAAMKTDADPAVLISLLGILIPPTEAPFDAPPYPELAAGLERFLSSDATRLPILLTLLRCAADNGLLDVTPDLIARPYVSMSLASSGELEAGATESLRGVTLATLDLNDEQPEWLASLLAIARHVSDARELATILDEVGDLATALAASFDSGTPAIDCAPDAQ